MVRFGTILGSVRVQVKPWRPAGSQRAKAVTSALGTGCNGGKELSNPSGKHGL